MYNVLHKQNHVARRELVRRYSGVTASPQLIHDDVTKNARCHWISQNYTNNVFLVGDHVFSDRLLHFFQKKVNNVIAEVKDFLGQIDQGN